MVVIISKSETFKDFSSHKLENAGYITLFADYIDIHSLINNTIDTIFLIHTSPDTKDIAQASVSSILLNIPNSKILVAAEIPEGSPSRYLELEGSDKQLVFPFTGDDLIRSVQSLLQPEITIKELFMKSKNYTFLLNRPLELSKSEYVILRLIAKAYPNVLSKENISKALSISANAVPVHISGINKAADRITERRLVIFKNGYKLNDLM